MPSFEWPIELSPFAVRDAVIEAQALCFAWGALWLAAWGLA